MKKAAINDIRIRARIYPALLALVAILFVSPLRAQDSLFRHLQTLPFGGSEFAVDQFENLYLLTPTGQLKKYGASGDSLAVFNDVRRFGRLHSFDVSNPLRPLLFYKDFSTIVLLDRFLAVKATLDLRRQGIAQVSAATNAYNNDIWIFDAVENKLKKIDETGRMLQETPDFRQLFDRAFVPDHILDQDAQVFLYDQRSDVLIFDYFGTLQKKQRVGQWQSFQVRNRQLIGMLDGGIVLLNTATQQQRYLAFPPSFRSFRRYVLHNDKIYALGPDHIRIYRVGF